jgi:hypothetical protein
MEFPKHWNLIPVPGKVVGIIEHQGKVIVATENGVYRLEGEELVPIKFQELPAKQVQI